MSVSGSVTLAGAAVGVENIVDFSGLLLGGSAATNYTLAGANGAVTVTNLFSPFSITSASLDSTGTNFVVCWQSTPGNVYEVLTNATLFPTVTWGAIGAPVTATDTNTCLTLPGGIGASPSAIVIIREP